jgi:C4-dicarboxylate-specific signal transduction histidine kinase
MKKLICLLLLVFFQYMLYAQDKTADGVVEISVKDNDNGFPQKPLTDLSTLFTTKPAGQGTGLGLSYAMI